jgi:3-deoxy-D-manno-octulosonate 8-phosphate phosphatase (KDO 8-P phosphatase)
MDVDGTLTDGKIYMGVDGEAFKAFDIKDGYALHTLLKEHGIIPVIITARKSPMVEHRCKELGVTEIHQGIMNKLDCLKGILEKYSSADQQYDLSNVAYIGDDLLDLQCMKPITEVGGIAGCPSNAVKEVLAISDFIALHKGGEGAVRDFVEYIIDRGIVPNDTDIITQRLSKAIAYIDNMGDCKIGKYEITPDFYVNVIEYVPKEEKEVLYESHRRYIDIQRIVAGEELLMVTDISNLTPCSEYDKDNDYLNYSNNKNYSCMVLRKGSCVVLSPKDGHKAVRYCSSNVTVKKIVGKMLI